MLRDKPVQRICKQAPCRSAARSRPEWSSHHVPLLQATEKLVQYEAKGLHELPEAQRDALQQAKLNPPQVPGMVPVVAGEGTSGSVSAVHCTAHIAGGPSLSPMDTNFTQQVKDEMRRRGGAFDKLRAMREAGKITSYKNKKAACLLDPDRRDKEVSFDINTGEILEWQ